MMNIKNLFKSTLFKNSLIYGATNALYTGLPLILMPLLVAILKPEDYGLIELFRSITLICIPLIGLSTISCIDRFYFEYTELKYQKLMGNVIIIHIVLFFISVLVLMLISSFLPKKYELITFLALIFCLFNQIQEVYLVSLRVRNKAFSYLRIRLGSVLFDLLLLFIAFKIFDSFDWTFRVYPNILSTIVFGVLVLFIGVFSGQIKFKFSLSICKEAIYYSAPLILHLISGYILNLSNRFFIVGYRGEGELGNFSLAYQVGMAISFIYTSFNMAWTPTFYSYLKENKTEQVEKIRKIIYISIFVIGGVIFLLWLFISRYYLLDNKYSVSDLSILLLILSFIILSYYKFEGNYYFFHMKTGKLSIFTLLSCLLAVLLNFLLIPKFGTLGAAMSTLSSYLLLYILVLMNKKSLFK